MAKKKEKKILEPFSGQQQPSQPSMDEMRYHISIVMAMTALDKMGVTPEDYAEFLKHKDQMPDLFKMFEENPEMIEAFMGYSDNRDDDASAGMPTLPRGRGRKTAAINEQKPMADAKNKTLRLKIQLQGVTKPSMWREVEVPANFNFTQLHYVIQAVTALEDAHLWSFQAKAYDPSLEIGIPLSRKTDGFGLEECTHNSDKTAITSFLAKKGDKLEYVYDFGDDWIFEVSVLDVVDTPCPQPKLTKWKSDFQPVENSGGVWAYMQMREAKEKWATLKVAEKRRIAGDLGFDEYKYFEEMIDEAAIDPVLIEEELADIPAKWEAPY